MCENHDDPISVREVKQKLSEGLSRDDIQNLKHRRVAPGFSVEDLLEMMRDFESIQFTNDGKWISK